MNRLKTYGWDPVLRMTRQGVLDEYAVKAPQTKGIPGWLCLTRDEASLPIAFWIPRKNGAVPQVFRMVWDERCFEDTILRAEYTPTHLYLADVWMWNGTPCKKVFSERYALLKNAFVNAYTSCPAFESKKVELRENALPGDIRGYEYYADIPNERGVFTETVSVAEAETVGRDRYEIIATDIPDVYKVADVGYLRVKTLALSKQLREMGRVFTLECTQNEDGTWTPKIE